MAGSGGGKAGFGQNAVWLGMVRSGTAFGPENLSGMIGFG